MNKRYDICGFTALAATMFMFASPTSAHEKVVVVPLGGTVGDAIVSDVVKGKTFSSKSGKGLTGTLELPSTVPTHTNSIGMTFNLLPAGTFTMGSPPDELGRSFTETQHQVTLSTSFYMQTTEVTNKQWNTLIIDYTAIGSNPSLNQTGDNYPVNNMSWFEAALFANILSTWEGRSECYQLTGCTGEIGAGRTCTGATINSGCTGYRLPTEAEWEYAARATTTTAWANPQSFDNSPYGTTIHEEFNSNLYFMGWYMFNNAVYTNGSKPVAQKRANRWGLYDMHGNLNEWCQDLWESGIAYSSAPVTDPTGDATGSYRVYRGGYYNNYAMHARSASRKTGSPEDPYEDHGFRLVLPLAQ